MIKKINLIIMSMMAILVFSCTQEISKDESENKMSKEDKSKMEITVAELKTNMGTIEIELFLPALHNRCLGLIIIFVQEQKGNLRWNVPQAIIPFCLGIIPNFLPNGVQCPRGSRWRKIKT